MQYYTNQGLTAGPVVKHSNCMNDTTCVAESGFGACCMNVYLIESPSRPTNK